MAVPRSRQTLIAHRRAAGLSQDGLAKRVGCSRSTVGNLETGDLHGITTDLARRIAEVFHLSAEELFFMPSDASDT